MNVKICGITRPQDAREAERYGAWAVGLISWKESSRFVDESRATEIVRALEGRALPIGVFVDSKLDEIESWVTRAGIRGVQLHGDETPDFARQVRARFPSIYLLRAFQPERESDLEQARPFLGIVDAILLDSHSTDGKKGGTGQTGDWSVAARASASLGGIPVMLAGGLKPGNVAEAVRTARPFAVDVASGVESEAGIKDPAKIRSFIEEAKKA